MELHQRFGGRRQGGISPSAQTPNVFIFYDPKTGHQHGYYDEWRADGCLHYTGEGQVGDQEMKSGNATILHHKAQGRALRVFQGARGVVTYEGEFELDDASEPRADLCDLLSEQGIVVIHQTAEGFEDSTGGALVKKI